MISSASLSLSSGLLTHLQSFFYLSILCKDFRKRTLQKEYKDWLWQKPTLIWKILYPEGTTKCLMKSNLLSLAGNKIPRYLRQLFLKIISMTLKSMKILRCFKPLLRLSYWRKVQSQHFKNFPWYPINLF